VLPGLAGVAAVDDEVAVELERNAAGEAYRVLEGGVAARPVAGVEVGEAVEHLVVSRRIVEQVGDAEVEAAARVNTSSRTEPAIGRDTASSLTWRSAKSMLTCIGPAGAHRVVAGEQALAERHLADELLEQVAQLLLGLRRLDPLAPGARVGRAQASAPETSSLGTPARSARRSISSRASWPRRGTVGSAR
jgi:hypothetical protein